MLPTRQISRFPVNSARGIVSVLSSDSVGEGARVVAPGGAGYCRETVIGAGQVSDQVVTVEKLVGVGGWIGEGLLFPRDAPHTVERMRTALSDHYRPKPGALVGLLVS